MEISESKVRAIVENIVARVVTEQNYGGSVSNLAPPSPPREIGVFDDLDQAVAAAKTAYEEFKAYNLEARERIIAAVRNACRRHVEVLARMAVEETSFGRYDDKIKKNHLVIDKTPGTEDLVSRSISGD